MRFADQLAALLRRLASLVPTPRRLAWQPIPVATPHRAPAVRRRGRAG